jgi:phosphoribosyl-dephospho-CoA transferase
MRRHDLAYVRPQCWHAVLSTRVDLLGDVLVASWIERGLPLIVRRARPDEGDGVPLGLPLPPFAGKRRLSFLVPAEEIVSIEPPLSLDAACRAAPDAWRPTLERLSELASHHALDARVFGSLAWETLTGFAYVADRSDVDLLLSVGGDTDVLRLAASLAALEAGAPMRLDGEFVRTDGAAVNWRELRSGVQEVVVKTIAGVALVDAAHFLRNPGQS